MQAGWRTDVNRVRGGTGGRYGISWGDGVRAAVAIEVGHRGHGYVDGDYCYHGNEVDDGFNWVCAGGKAIRQLVSRVFT